MRLSPAESRRLLDWATKQARKIRRPTSKAMMLLRLAIVWAKNGYSSEGSRLVEEATVISGELGQLDRSLVMAEAALALAKNGSLERACEILRDVASAAKRLRAVAEAHGIFFRLAEVYCDLGLHRKALALCKETAEDLYSDAILIAVSRKYAQAGDLISALDTVAGLATSVKSGELVGIILGCLEKEAVSQDELAALKRTCETEGS